MFSEFKNVLREIAATECVCSVTQSWIEACQAVLNMEFSSQEYWSRLPFPISGDLPNPGIDPMFLGSLVLAGGFFMTSATLEAMAATECHTKF